MAIDIVPFTTAHLIGCAEIFVQAFAAPPWHEIWPVEHARIHLSDLLATPRAIGLVTLDPDSRLPLGFALGNANQGATGLEFRLKELCVDPAHQGLGVGGILMRALEAHLVAEGIMAISLTTEGEAIRFYDRLGYEPQPAWVAMTKDLVRP